MKRLLCLVCALSVFLMTGCSSDYHKNDDKISIVTTMFASYDFARQIAGDKADVTMLLKPGEETHSYEPSPKDIIKIEECDIFIYVGGENDAWVDRILSGISGSDMKVIKMLDLVDKYEEEIIEGMESHEEEAEDEEEAEWDEHVWTDPENAAVISKEIAKVLIETDNANKSYYESNCEKYVGELMELDSKFQELIDNAVRKEIIFGDRFPLRYFVEAYGLKYYAAFPGCASETEPGSKTIAFLIDKAKKDGIPVIFTIELSNGNIAKTIADDANAKVMTFYTCHNVSKSDFENGETYLSLMKKNLTSLKEALY